MLNPASRTAALTGVACALLLMQGCERTEQAPAAGDVARPLLAPGLTPAALEARVDQFARATIDIDAASLEEWERQVLAKLILASDLMHEIYLEQVSPRLPAWRAQLAAEDGPARDAALAYFDLMAGPWDRLQQNEPFLEVGPKPAGAGYYPEHLTREELDGWLVDHPEDREAFTGYFTVIERQRGNLVAVPYSERYADRLRPAAQLLQEAAAIAESRAPTLARYLDTRAASFLSNDYFQSDMAWMDIEGTRIEPTIGPYEVYEDELMGYKAAFESFITVADSAASAELDALKGTMQLLESRLPIEERYRNTERGFESPIRVVDVAYTAGDARRGVQTIAFNLPNDERVREAKGSKKVMLRNVMQAKFENTLSPIAARVLAPELAGEVSFRPWFINVLMHELAHGLGPGFIAGPEGSRTTVNQALREHYSPLEEAKADVAGLHNLAVLAEQGMYDSTFVRQAYLSHLADMFRAVRFGASAAHGRSNLLQFNYLWSKGAITADPDGRITTDLARLVDTNRELATEILTIQATGDYEAAGELLRTYAGSVRPEMQRRLDGLDDVPVDILPLYPTRARVEDWLGG
ncbi:MAG: dipeptidyl-peptidase 3 family protein [Longimicrobiales bacterium]